LSVITLYQPSQSLVVVRGAQVISVHFAADSMAEPCACPLVKSIMDPTENARISYVMGNLPKRRVLQDDGGHGRIRQRYRMSCFAIQASHHLGCPVSRAAVV
jgi:hypothetical protein